MKLRNYTKKLVAELDGDKLTSYLQESVLLLGLKFVGAKELDTAQSLLLVQTLVVTLQQGKDVVKDDGL